MSSKSYGVFRRHENGALTLEYETNRYVLRGDLPVGWKCIRLSDHPMPMGKPETSYMKHAPVHLMTRAELEIEVMRLRANPKYRGNVLRMEKIEKILK